MCNVCGCGEGEVHIDGQDPHHQDHGHRHGHGHAHGHHHDHGPTEGPADETQGPDHLDYGAGPARAHAPGMSQERMVQIERNVLDQNDAYARANRAAFRGRGQLALNLVSSPGSGKTTLLTRTIEALAGRFPAAVIEGDQQTTNDADQIRATGASTVQINTGKGCHLDGHMVGHAMESLDAAENGVVFIENVGNLVCPATFDLGEAAKVAILSVTEGEDKPVKYPDMFHRADLMVLNKVDLLPHLEFDVEQCLAYARQVNPDIEVLQLSATTGDGMEAWLDWIGGRRRALLEDVAGDLEQRAARVRAAAGEA